MITFLRYLFVLLKKVFLLGTLVFLVGIIALFFVRIVSPYFASLETFSRWSLFEPVQENVTIINQGDEVTIRDDDQLDRFAENVRNSVVQIVLEERGGIAEALSGFFVTSDGLVVSSYVGQENDLKDVSFRARLMNGSLVQAEFFGYDDYYNLLYIRLENGNYSLPAFANDQDMRAGRKVISLELGSAKERGEITLGVVKEIDPYFSLSSQLLAQAEKHQGVFLVDFFDTDIALGTPVLNYVGEIVGIIGRKTFGDTNAMYVLGSDEIKKSRERVASRVDAEDAFFGASYVPLSPENALRYGLDVQEGAWLAYPEGVRGQVTLYNSPAQNAGLRYGDIIVAVNDIPINQENSLSETLQTFQSGEVVMLFLNRDGERVTLEATLE